MAKRKPRSRKRTVRNLIRKIIVFFTVLAWLMNFVLTAVELWDRFFG